MQYGRSVSKNILEAQSRAQTNSFCTAKIVVVIPAAFSWSNLYTYLFGRHYYTIITLQKIVSNDLKITIITRVAIHVT